MRRSHCTMMIKDTNAYSVYRKRKKKLKQKMKLRWKSANMALNLLLETPCLQNFDGNSLFFFSSLNLLRGKGRLFVLNPSPHTQFFYSTFLRQDKSVTTFQTKHPASTKCRRQDTPRITHFKNKGARHRVPCREINGGENVLQSSRLYSPARVQHLRDSPQPGAFKRPWALESWR